MRTGFPVGWRLACRGLGTSLLSYNTSRSEAEVEVDSHQWPQPIPWGALEVAWPFGVEARGMDQALDVGFTYGGHMTLDKVAVLSQ